MKTQNNIFSLLLGRVGVGLIALCTLFSCTPVNIPEPGNSDLAGVKNLQYSTSGRDLTLSWELPAAGGVEMVGIEIIKNNSELTTIDSLCTSHLIKRAAVNTELSYAVRIKYADGRVSPNASLIFTIAYEEKARPAMVLLGSDIRDLETEEEKGAARWFKQNYVDKGEGNFITAEDLAAGINMGEVSMIWIHVDRIEIEQGAENLPEELTNNAVKTAMRNFIMNGGNVYLSKHATQLITTYGRINAKYAPNIFNSADGAEGADVWSINANLLGGQMDKRGHAFFTGMQKNSDENTTFPLLGPVYRYDHNCMWDMNQLEFTKSGANNFEKFQKQTNSEILATWSHVTDDAVAGQGCQPPGLHLAVQLMLAAGHRQDHAGAPFDGVVDGVVGGRVAGVEADDHIGGLFRRIAGNIPQLEAQAGVAVLKAVRLHWAMTSALRSRPMTAGSSPRISVR